VLFRLVGSARPAIGARPETVRGCCNVWNYVIPRPARLIVQGLALGGVVAGSVAFASADKSVDVVVDGQSRSVHVFGSTVGDVLADQGITVGAHDIVSPSVSSRVQDGSAVVVRYGRELTVTTDGRTQTYWTTALSVNEAIQQLGLRADTAQLSVSRSLPLGRQGLTLGIDTLKQVRLVVGGRPAVVSTYATTVGALLDQRSLQVGALDRLSAPLSTALGTGDTVTLDRVEQKQTATTRPVGFSTSTTLSSTLDKGTTKTLTRGEPGLSKDTFRDTYVNGRLASHTLLTTIVVTRPVAEVQQIGTKVAPVSSGTSVSVSPDGLNWAALARCESGGNPRAVNPGGYYGLYQFSLRTWASVGGSGNPVDASPAEQTARGQALYRKAGAGQWSCGSHLFD
jgi:uncharacterized protein YabE (DUF348 family)